jgi:flagellar biosynthesis component FlhA
MNRRLETLRDIWGYVKATRNYVIGLVIFFLLLLGAVVVLTEGAAVMPFIYTIF